MFWGQGNPPQNIFDGLSYVVHNFATDTFVLSSALVSRFLLVCSDTSHFLLQRYYSLYQGTKHTGIVYGVLSNLR